MFASFTVSLLGSEQHAIVEDYVDIGDNVQKSLYILVPREFHWLILILPESSANPELQIS